MRDPSFTLGIEEEYLLVDRQSRDLVIDPPPGLMEACEKATDGRVSPEFIRSQVEVATGVCRSVEQAAREMQQLRRAVAGAVEGFGLGLIAASTHPFAKPESQLPTAKARYAGIARDLQGVGRRLVVSGMHVHAGLDDDDLRIDLMSQLAYFTPHLLALSTSSPFWGGEDSGLKSYRVAVYTELPRSGTPEIFESWSEYQRHVDILVRAGVIEDGSKIWWDLRPSARFPTLELRIPDICTTLADGISIAALYLCLLHMLWRLKRANQRWRRYSTMLVRENRWRAQRYGTDEGLIDFGKGQIVPFATLLEEIIDLTQHDAAVLGCADEVRWSREILRRGTSAHRQLAVYRQALDAGAEKPEALRRVVDFLLEETLAGT
jgi:carboxylate-amine ligase